MPERPFRDRLRHRIESGWFERTVIAVIVVNAVTLGLETVPVAMAAWGALISGIDRACLAVFVAELAARMYVHRLRFFRDPWSVFDFAVVAIALLPATGSLSVLRALRVLRTLRLISTVPRLRRVVAGLLGALPGLGAVGSILALIFYVGAVVATRLFAPTFPEWFGTLGASAYTLFQVMTLESWSMGIVRPVMEQHPWAWTFFVSFILVTTFTMLNLFIAVIVNAMQAETEAVAEERAREGHEERVALLEEVRAIRRELAELRGRPPDGDRR